MEKLNDLEITLLERISLKYPSIKKHIPFLEVSGREFTGVGMYVNFCYTKSIDDIPKLEISDGSLSTNENINIDGLKYGLGYEVDITNGMIKFIELITYGEEWNGEFRDYKFD